MNTSIHFERTATAVSNTFEFPSNDGKSNITYYHPFDINLYKTTLGLKPSFTYAIPLNQNSKFSMTAGYNWAIADIAVVAVSGSGPETNKKSTINLPDKTGHVVITGKNKNVNTVPIDWNGFFFGAYIMARF